MSENAAGMAANGAADKAADRAKSRKERRRRKRSHTCHCCGGEFMFCWQCRCGFSICQACMYENQWGMTCNGITWDCPDCGQQNGYGNQ